MADTTGGDAERVPEVAPGVYQMGTKRVNWYLVETEGEVFVVDAGLPGHWKQLLSGLDALGYGLDDVAALVLTHGHPDHVGFAEHLRETAAVPVYVHEADAPLARGDDEAAGDQSSGEVLWNLWRPAVLRLLFELGRAGGLSIPPVEEVVPFEDETRLDVPGAPRAIHVPGHSAGSCALYLADRDVLLCGDALAMLDLKTGRADGPRLMALFNEDVGQAAASLDRIESLGEVTLLPGHGEPWHGGTLEAVRRARAVSGFEASD